MCDLGACLEEDMLLNDARFIHPLVEHGWTAKFSRCPSSVVRRPMPLHTHIQLVPTIFRPDTAKWRKQGQGLRQHGTLQRSLSSMQTNAHKNVVLYTSTCSTQEGSQVFKMFFPSCSTKHWSLCAHLRCSPGPPITITCCKLYCQFCQLSVSHFRPHV